MTQIQANPTIRNLVTVPATAPTNVNAQLAEAQHELEARIGAFTRVRRAFAFLGWVFTGFGLVSLFRRSTVRGASEEIVVYTVHPSFYLWAIIALGFIASACVNHWPGGAVAWGWAYVLVLLCTIVTLLFDVSTLKALLWGGIFCLVWIASKYLEDLKGMTVLSGVGHYLAGLHPRLDPGTASVMSWLLLLPWVGALLHAFSRGRKAFSPNSIEERFFGEGREITDRSGLKFRTRYRDWFETVLGLGACDLEAVDGNHHVVKRWENILFLTFVWRRLDQVLHQRAAVVDNAPSDPVEVEEVNKR